MRNHFVAVVAALALLSATRPGAASTTLPAMGGMGDASFNDRCPAQQSLIGLAGHVGLWIDRIQIICSPILPDGTHGTKYYGPVRGSNGGGSAIEMTCEADSVVYAARVYIFSVHNKVSRVDLSCGSMHADRQSNVAFDWGTAMPDVSYRQELQSCPRGELASGFNGHFGKDVNALGLDCDAVTIDDAPASSTSSVSTPYPIRVTGRPKSASGPAADPWAASGGLACPQGYVWRVASPTDHVCVTPVERSIVAHQNATAATHVSRTDQTYGPNTCMPGYVWREAYSGDVVCVTPPERDAARSDNANAPAQVPKN